MDYAKASSEQIKTLMRANRLSIRQLAEQVGVSPSTLTDGLKSKKGIPIDTMIRIAAYFQTTVPALCGVTEQQKAGPAQTGPAQTPDDIFPLLIESLTRLGLLREGEDLTPGQADVLVAVIQILRATFDHRA